MLADYFRVLVFALVGVGFFQLSSVLRGVRAGTGGDARTPKPTSAEWSPWAPPGCPPTSAFTCLPSFVIFDVEALFIFPWAVQFKTLGVEGFVAVLVFVGLLFMGLVYAWKKGALKWE
jgi:NADH-quinone oxidoreductase subunit A